MDCKNLDLQTKFVLRIRPDLKVYYVNKDFTDFTGFSEEEILLKPLPEILPFSIKEVYKKIILSHLPDEDPSYLILKGKTKSGECYWGLMRITSFHSKLSGETRYLLEIKMLPVDAIMRANDIFDKVEKVYESAGPEYGEKFFLGFLEERNQSFEDFIIEILGVKKKKLDKYFKI